MTSYERLSAGNFKFTRSKPRKQTGGPVNVRQTSVPESQPNPVRDQPWISAAHSEPQTDTATGRPISDLSHEGEIWRMYVEEAQEHDTELFDGENNNLDTMLLFAALFSAILTTFIIESKGLLQRDNADLTVTLLLVIAQSQQRMEQGISQVTPPIELPSFSAPLTARWINGLWFTSLALSLAAALMAMLAKEWLTEYTTSHPRPAHEHALDHQKRLRGFRKWGAQHLIDLLPSMLHLSLLLFSLGLAIYLWTLESSIAVAEIIIASGTLLFYVMTVVLGATYKSCPFKTQVSRYLHDLPKFLRRKAQRFIHDPSVERKVPHDEKPDETTDEELQALRWLIENTRDPAVGDNACKALAGLQFLRSPLQLDSPQESTQVPEEPGNLPELLNDVPLAVEITDDAARIGPANKRVCITRRRYILLRGLFRELFGRITQAQRRLAQEPADSRGTRMAEFIYAIPAVFYLLETDFADNLDLYMTGARSHFNAESKTQSLLAVLDFAWETTCPELDPDIYAIITAAKLRILVTIAHSWHSKPPSQSQNSAIRDAPHFEHLNTENNKVQVTVDFVPLLPNIQARYSCALVHAGMLLRYHNRYETTLSLRSLARLLGSITLAARCPILNQESQLSTCFPQSLNNEEILPLFTVLTPQGHHEFRPLEFGDPDGIIVGLVQQISSLGIENTPSLEISAGRALCAMFPMLLKQWVHMMKSSGHKFDHYKAKEDCIQVALNRWPNDRKADQHERLSQWTLTQLLLIAMVAVSLADCDQMSCLPRIAVRALLRRADTESGQAALHDVLGQHGSTLSRIVDFGYEHRLYLMNGTMESLQKLLTLKHKDKITLQFLPSDFSSRHLQRLMIYRDGEPKVISSILANLQKPQKLQEPFDHLWCLFTLDQQESLPNVDDVAMFAEYPRNFLALIELGDNEQCRPFIAACLSDIIRGIHDECLPNKDEFWFIDSFVGLLLKALQVVVQQYFEDINKAQSKKSDETRSKQLEETRRLKCFLANVSDIWNVLDNESQMKAKKNPDLAAATNQLASRGDSAKELVDEISQMRKWMDGDPNHDAAATEHPNSNS